MMVQLQGQSASNRTILTNAAGCWQREPKVPTYPKKELRAGSERPERRLLHTVPQEGADCQEATHYLLFDKLNNGSALVGREGGLITPA